MGFLWKTCCCGKLYWLLLTGSLLWVWCWVCTLVSFRFNSFFKLKIYWGQCCASDRASGYSTCDWSCMCSTAHVGFYFSLESRHSIKFLLWTMDARLDFCYCEHISSQSLGAATRDFWLNFFQLSEVHSSLFCIFIAVPHCWDLDSIGNTVQCCKLSACIRRLPWQSRVGLINRWSMLMTFYHCTCSGLTHKWRTYYCVVTGVNYFDSKMC